MSYSTVGGCLALFLLVGLSLVRPLLRYRERPATPSNFPSFISYLLGQILWQKFAFTNQPL